MGLGLPATPRSLPRTRPGPGPGRWSPVPVRQEIGIERHQGQTEQCPGLAPQLARPARHQRGQDQGQANHRQSRQVDHALHVVVHPHKKRSAKRYHSLTCHDQSSVGRRTSANIRRGRASRLLIKGGCSLLKRGRPCAEKRNRARCGFARPWWGPGVHVSAQPGESAQQQPQL